jgi:hypothetical protein
MDQDHRLELDHDNKEHRHVDHQQLVHHQHPQQNELCTKNIFFRNS